MNFKKFLLKIGRVYYFNDTIKFKEFGFGLILF